MLEGNVFNSTVIRNADELARHNSLSKTLPRSGGEKCYAPSGTWLEEKMLDSLLQERSDALQWERIVKRSDLSYGEWHPDVGFVSLTKSKGKLLQHMGFHQKGKHFLYPIEALFLMESSVLQVTYKGFPLSVEQGYALLLTDGLEKYQVYSHLARFGYTVVVHQKSEKITSYEKKIRLDGYIKRKKDRSAVLLDGGLEAKEEITKQTLNSPVVLLPKTNSTEVTNSESLSNPPLQDICSSSNIGTSQTVSDLRESKHVLPSTSHDECLKSKCPNTSLYELPNFLPGKEITISCPPSHLLPKNVSPSRSSYTIRPQHFHASRKGHSEVGRRLTHSRWHRETHDRRPTHYENEIRCHERNLNSRGRFSSRHDRRVLSRSFPKRRRESEPVAHLEEYPCAIPKLNFKVKNWKEFKSAVGSTSKAGWPLFVDDICPLVSKTLSTDELHSTIKIVNEVNFNALVDKFSKSESSRKIDFDVYLPQLSRKNSKPSLRLTVINSQQAVPSLAEVAAFYIDDVQLYFAVVDHGEINFYGFQPVTLCPVKPMSSVEMTKD